MTNQGNKLVTAKCDEHKNIIRTLYRIEGENLAIISLLGLILTLVIARII